jgi:hypothetical protein
MNILNSTARIVAQVARIVKCRARKMIDKILKSVKIEMQNARGIILKGSSLQCQPSAAFTAF